MHHDEDYPMHNNASRKNTEYGLAFVGHPILDSSRLR